MNIAEDVRDSRLVKVHVASAAGFIQSKIEALAFKQRKHIVKERIVIGKRHHRAHRHHQHMRLEAFVSLHQSRAFVPDETPPA